jgi:conjugal transfer/entry exclusion protein
MPFPFLLFLWNFLRALLSVKALGKDKAFEAQSQLLSGLVQRAESEREFQARQATAQHRQYLLEQGEEQARRRAAAKEDRFGAVGKGYFDGFGTSVR